MLHHHFSPTLLSPPLYAKPFYPTLHNFASPCLSYNNATIQRRLHSPSSQFQTVSPLATHTDPTKCLLNLLEEDNDNQKPLALCPATANLIGNRRPPTTSKDNTHSLAAQNHTTSKTPSLAHSVLMMEWSVMSTSAHDGTILSWAQSQEIPLVLGPEGFPVFFGFGCWGRASPATQTLFVCYVMTVGAHGALTSLQ